MASVASSGASPLTSYDPLLDSTGDDESWAFIDPSGSSNSGSVGFFPSPASGSLASYGVVGYQGQIQPSPPAPSPLQLDVEHVSIVDQTAGFSIPFSDHTTQLNVSAVADASFLSSAGPQLDLAGQFMSPDDYIFDEQQLQDLTPFLNTLPSDFTQHDLTTFQPSLQSGRIETAQGIQTNHADISSWPPTSLKQADTTTMFVMEDFNFASHSPQHPVPSSISSSHSGSPRSPNIKLESETSKAPSPIRKVRGAARVEKKKAPPSESSLSSSSGSNASASKFVIMTPATVDANQGKLNPFECFEAMRTTHKGRKGPLANDTKENALQVRRLGACFCCHARKVKCDAERPCKNCKKLACQVPQVVCWQFQDFLTVLFPDFIRNHFKKEEMAKFISENISSFTLKGEEKTCTVQLISGYQLTTKMTVRAKFFTPKTRDVLMHYHLNTEGQEHVSLQANGAVPIGLEIEGSSQREELRKKAKEYIHSIAREPSYAYQLTDSVRHTVLPRQVLEIVQRYAKRTDSPIVRKALNIYAMHYVMTRHLCLTQESIAELKPTKLVPPSTTGWVTPRVLNRQIKSLIDELLMREVQTLFEAFSKSLKPKSRREWAPCTAAFLVLCLFLETVELAGDYFVLAENEVALRRQLRRQQQQQQQQRQQQPPPPPPEEEEARDYDRAFVLRLNREVENLPFRQFAYQFHQIYQTHSRDAATRAFNPLVDDALLAGPAELDSAGRELALGLRTLLHTDAWRAAHEPDLYTLAAGPLLGDAEEEHLFPRDVSANYIGKLTARFLLSFRDESVIFGQEEAAGGL